MEVLSKENILVKGNIISRPKISPIGELLWKVNNMVKEFLLM
jgi:hypothetical protein